MSQPPLSTSPTTDHNKWLVIGIILLGAGLGAALYWPTLDLPLLYDDLLHIRISGDLDLVSVWLPTEAFGFYRPLTFLPLLIIDRIFGSYPPVLLHGMNVAQHALNAALLSWLSWRLWNRWHWTLASGLIFALYPFAYQAVAVYGHNVHPATTGLLLLALHTYLSALRAEGPGRNAWWFLTGLLFLFGLLSHESAILFGAFAALVHINERGRPAFKFRGQSAVYSQPWFFFLTAGFIYLVVYRFLPLTRTPQATFASAALQLKVLYILQAAAYPLAWFNRFLSDSLNVSVVLVGFALLLVLSYWAAKDLSNHLPLSMGWGWWGLASLLVALPLPANYLLHGPRLLYLAGAGIALLWPVLLEPFYELKPFGRPLWWGLLAFILVTSWIFIRGRLENYAQLTRPIVVVDEIMQDRPDEEGIILVNLPQWLSPAQNTYPIGVEFVAMLGDYLFVEELMAQNLGVDRPVQSIRVPDLLTSRDYQYAIHDQDQRASVQGDWAPGGSHIFIISYSADGPETEYKGYLRPSSGAEQPLAQIGPYELLDAEAAVCSGQLRLQTTWTVSDSTSEPPGIPPTTSIFAQLLDQEGQLITQADGPPLGLRPDLLDIPSNWEIIDRRIMSTNDMPSSQVLLGVYDYNDGQRYPVVDSGQQLVSDNALKINPVPCP